MHSNQLWLKYAVEKKERNELAGLQDNQKIFHDLGFYKPFWKYFAFG